MAIPYRATSTWALMDTDYIFNFLCKTIILTMKINRAQIEEHMISYRFNFFQKVGNPIHLASKNTKVRFHQVLFILVLK